MPIETNHFGAVPAICFLIAIVCFAIAIARRRRGNSQNNIGNFKGNLNTGKVSGNVVQTFSDHSHNTAAPASEAKRDAHNAHDWISLGLTAIGTLASIASVVIAYLVYRGGTR